MKKTMFPCFLFLLICIETSCLSSDYYGKYRESSTINNIKDGLMYIGGIAIGVTLFKVIQANTENYFQSCGTRTPLR